MDMSILNAEAIRGRLAPLNTSQIRALAARSGVPFTTLWKVRSGETKNPGVETVRQFWPHLELIGAEGAPEVRAAPVATTG